MSKFAPPNEDGLKPWVVTLSERGHKSERIVYAKSSADAKYRAIGRQLHVTGTVRRATSADIDAFNEQQ
jgi:hypothetical protein